MECSRESMSLSIRCKELNPWWLLNLVCDNLLKTLRFRLGLEQVRLARPTLFAQIWCISLPASCQFTPFQFLALLYWRRTVKLELVWLLVKITRLCGWLYWIIQDGHLKFLRIGRASWQIWYNKRRTPKICWWSPSIACCCLGYRRFHSFE